MHHAVMGVRPEQDRRIRTTGSHHSHRDPVTAGRSVDQPPGPDGLAGLGDRALQRIEAVRMLHREPNRASLSKASSRRESAAS
jgi:hypothetical protein